MKNPGLAGILLFNLCIQTRDHLHSDGVQLVSVFLVQPRLSLITSQSACTIPGKSAG
ncbi:hypothetical protein LGKMAHEF_02997 [Aeromonas salmonicida]|nr:Uncharacterised protein [Aeromonas salmonicida]SUU72339.1 Uncharacterised protein [Aeromonas salmonicida]